MHVHLPKPLHGWRAFVGEVGIIVLGVLIALGAEQVVESARAHARANETRRALRAEIGQGYLVAEEREVVASCIDQQLNRIEQGVLASGSTLQPLPVYGSEISFTLRVPLRTWATSAWQSAIAEGITAKLNASERELLPAYYAQMEGVHALGQQEEAMVGDVLALSKPLPLDPQVKSSFIREIEAERLRNRTMADTDAQVMTTIEKLGYAPSEGEQRDWFDQSGTVKFCREQNLPLNAPEKPS